MSATIAVDRSRLCTFTFENNAQCRIPLSPGHPYLCTFHARREAEDHAADEAVRDIAFPLSARYVSYCDLSSAIAHTIAAVAYNHIPTRTAATIAYLTQNLVQSLAGAEREYREAFGNRAWRETIAANFNTPRRPSDAREDLPNADVTKSSGPVDASEENPAELPEPAPSSADAVNNNQVCDDPQTDDSLTDNPKSGKSANPDSQGIDLNADNAGSLDTLNGHPSPSQVEALLNRLRIDLEAR